MSFSEDMKRLAKDAIADVGNTYRALLLQNTGWPMPLSPVEPEDMSPTANLVGEASFGGRHSTIELGHHPTSEMSNHPTRISVNNKTNISTNIVSISVNQKDMDSPDTGDYSI